MKHALNIQLACEGTFVTGESPVWSVRDQALYWVDVRSNAIHRLSQRHGLEGWHVGERISSVGFRKGGGLIGTLRSGIYAIDIAEDRTTASKQLILAPAMKEGERPKEGKTDRDGRWWFGSTNDESQAIGGYFSLSPDGRCQRIDVPVAMANGLAIPGGGDRLFAADSIADVVWSWELDRCTGAVSGQTVFFKSDWLPGLVDGATFDSEGYYWCAMFGDGAVARICPQGHIDRLIRLPVRYPTMCAFGGPDLDVLYVTSSRFHAQEDLASQPLAGALFKIEGLGVRGIEEPEFG